MNIQEYRLAVRTVHCPMCLVQPGQPCRKPGGGEVYYVHDDRSLAWQEACLRLAAAVER